MPRKLLNTNGHQSTSLETGKLHSTAPVVFDTPSRITNSGQRELLVFRHQNIRAGAEQFLSFASKGLRT